MDTDAVLLPSFSRRRRRRRVKLRPLLSSDLERRLAVRTCVVLSVAANELQIVPPAVRAKVSGAMSPDSARRG